MKFADTEKEKLQKKMQQMVALGGMGVNIGLGMGFPYFQHANYNAACQQVRNGSFWGLHLITSGLSFK